MLVVLDFDGGKGEEVGDPYYYKEVRDFWQDLVACLRCLIFCRSREVQYSMIQCSVGASGENRAR